METKNNGYKIYKMALDLLNEKKSTIFECEENINEVISSPESFLLKQITKTINYDIQKIDAFKKSN